MWPDRQSPWSWKARADVGRDPGIGDSLAIGYSRRVASGIDMRRLQLLVAVCPNV